MRANHGEEAGGTEEILARARGGDERAFRALTEPYLREIQLHCYRILGSVQDAEDALQETLLAAWRGLGGFEERASIRSWLYRIATNRALDAQRASRRRLEPYPDVLLEGVPAAGPGPDARYEAKEAVGLAFVAGLQHLPPAQRAALVLRDVLGYRAAEVASMLGTSAGAVDSLLRRARAAFASRLPSAGRERAPLPGSPREREVVGRFAEAVEAGDVEGMVALLTGDAWLTMPPEPHEYQGPAPILAFLRGREVARATLRLVPARANGQPAFSCYRGREPYAVFVLTLDGDRISAVTWFGDADLVPRFGPARFPG